jgi:hypothetical protein
MEWRKKWCKKSFSEFVSRRSSTSIPCLSVCVCFRVRDHVWRMKCFVFFNKNQQDILKRWCLRKKLYKNSESLCSTKRAEREKAVEFLQFMSLLFRRYFRRIFLFPWVLVDSSFFSLAWTLWSQRVWFLVSSFSSRILFCKSLCPNVPLMDRWCSREREREREYFVEISFCEWDQVTQEV